MSVCYKPTFEIFVDDRRYTVPTLHLVSADDEVGARDIAERLLSESSHHVGAEVWWEGKLLLGLGSFAVRPRHRTGRPGDRLAAFIAD
ncbi:MAG: hypothetical protein ACJ798_19005 [Phenylobacterium sp.]